MRKIADVLRLKAAGMSVRDIATSVGAGRTTVCEYLARAEAAGISWPLPDDLDEEALELKLFEDQKDFIKLKNLVSSVVDKDTQEKIDVVRQRLMKGSGYCEICSTDVLNFVASIFARGDAKEER